MLRFGVVVLVGLWVSAPAGAAAVFDEVARDFGVVPRGPTLTHPFRFTNTGAAPVHVAGVRVSCGCVSASPSQRDVAPGASAVIEVRMDTRRFVGFKAVTVYVQFDRPAWEEVRLSVQANGRDDVAVTPAALALGKVKRGAATSGSVAISLLGHDGWQIEDVERGSNYLVPELKELSRQGGEVRYELTVRLREDTPVGNWYTDVWLKTNNPAAARVRVPLTVEVEPALTLSPDNAAFGDVRAGEQSERRILVRGAQPFRITTIHGADDVVRVRGSSPGAKAVHVLTIQLRPAEAGELLRRLRVVTDLPGEGEIEVHVVAQVVAPD